jgi:hypothetical protein
MFDRDTTGDALAIVVFAAAAILFAATGTATEAGLTRLGSVDVDVEIDPALDTISAHDLAARVVDGLRRADPPLAVAEGAPDRVRLTVAVRPVSATTLRGFWLPFSGTYAVGAVELGVVRMVALPGTASPFPAVVWGTRRQVGAPLRLAEPEIARLIDDMLAELLATRRRGAPPVTSGDRAAPGRGRYRAPLRDSPRPTTSPPRWR